VAATESIADDAAGYGDSSDADSLDPPSGEGVDLDAAGASGLDPDPTGSSAEVPDEDVEPPTGVPPSEESTPDSPDAAAPDPAHRIPEGAERVAPGTVDAVGDASAGPSVPGKTGIDATPVWNPDGDRKVQENPVGPDTATQEETGTRTPRRSGSSGGPSIDIGEIIDDLTPEES